MVQLATPAHVVGYMFTHAYSTGRPRATFCIKSASATAFSRGTEKIRFGATGESSCSLISLWGKSPDPVAESAGCEREKPGGSPPCCQDGPRAQQRASARLLVEAQ